MTFKSFLMIGAMAAGFGATALTPATALADGYPASLRHPAPGRHKPKPVRQATRIKVVERVVERPVYIEKIVKVPVDRPVYVDRPVEKIVEKVINVPVDRPVYVDRPVDRVVERRVEVPVVKVVERPVYIDRPVDRIIDRVIERRVEIPVERPVYIERRVYVDREPSYHERYYGGSAVVESSESRYESESYSSSAEESRWSQGRYGYGQAYDLNPFTGQSDGLMTGLNMYGTTARYGAGGGWIPRQQSNGSAAWGMSRAYGSASASSSAHSSASASTSVHVGGGSHGGGGHSGGCCGH